MYLFTLAYLVITGKCVVFIDKSVRVGELRIRVSKDLVLIKTKSGQRQGVKWILLNVAEWMVFALHGRLFVPSKALWCEESDGAVLVTKFWLPRPERPTQSPTTARLAPNHQLLPATKSLQSSKWSWLWTTKNSCKRMQSARRGPLERKSLMQFLRPDGA